MNNLLAKIKNDIGNLKCLNCKKTAIITIIGDRVNMNIDCPKDETEVCIFFNQLDSKLRKHTFIPEPKKDGKYFTSSSKFQEIHYSNPYHTSFKNRGIFIEGIGKIIVSIILTIANAFTKLFLRNKSSNNNLINSDNLHKTLNESSTQYPNEFNTKISVPICNYAELQYFSPSCVNEENLRTFEQKSFYNYFKSEINRGNKIEIYGNKGYVILLVNEYLELLHNHRNYSINETINRLKILNEFYDFIDLSEYIGDVYCYGGQFHAALNTYKLNPKLLNARLSNKILNLKSILGLNISPIEILCTRKKITKYALDNIEKFIEFSEIVLNQDTLIRGQDFLKYINTKYKNNRRTSFEIFYESTDIGSALRQKFYQRHNLKTYYYPQIVEFVEYCNELSRKAENLQRVNFNLPKVGEGWITETALFYQIKSHLSNHFVLQHASPKWLVGQHFDIFIPSLNLAFEYHGKQHFEPVAIFGGQKGFEDTKKRDKMKRKKCRENNVTLIELKENYDFNEVIKVINACLTVV